MLSEMTAEQFFDWIEYDNQCPFGDERADMRQAAGLAWNLATKTSEVESPSLMYPYWEPESSFEDRCKQVTEAASKWQTQSQGSPSTLPQTSQD